MRSGSTLALVDVREVLLRGVSGNFEDCCDSLNASARIGLAEPDTKEADVA